MTIHGSRRNMNITKKSIPFLLLFLITGLVWSDNNDGGVEFTGELLTQLYVTDVRKGVAFYQAIGFTHYYYYDYETGKYYRDWNQAYAPLYAEMEMIGGNIRISMTTHDEKEKVYGGGVRHYFIIQDVHNHYANIKSNGIIPAPDEVEERPWMSFFTVRDPDNHQIVFGEKDQAHYEQARQEIESQLGRR